MPLKRKLTFPTSVDMVSEPKKWYIDIYDLQGKKLPRLHMFSQSNEDADVYKDFGQVKSICVTGLDANPDIQCVDIEVPGDLSYQMSPQAYMNDRMMVLGDDTMFSRGWKLESNDASSFTCQMLETTISEIRRWKFPNPKKQANSAQQRRSSKKSSTIDSQNPSTSEAGTSNILNTKRLSNLARKAKDSSLGGMTKYKEYFPFGLYKEFEIPVENCFQAPVYVICRELNEKKLEIVFNWFSSRANNPSSCAYLMPIKWIESDKAIPLEKKEVKLENVHEYHYWIIDGQHSISAAKALVQAEWLPEDIQYLKDVYKYRKARIIVEAPAKATVAISRLANMEAQALFTKQPYSQILRHLRSQYEYYGKPSRPGVGIVKGHASRSDWDNFISTAETIMGINFAQKQSHMVACPDDVFAKWSTIITRAEKGELGGKRPNPSNFRCLCGLEMDEVRTIQEKIMDGSLVISKGSSDIDQNDMADFILETKQNNILREALFQVLSQANPAKEFANWKEMSTFYYVTKGIFGIIKRKCAKWISSKVTVGKAVMEFPSDVREYIKWIVEATTSKLNSKDYPWQIPMINFEMEGKFFLGRAFNEGLPIGLCVMDSTEGSARDILWSAENFSQLLLGILKRTNQFVFLSFLKIVDVVRLQDALQSLSCWQKMFIGTIHYVEDAPCVGAIQLLSVVIYLSSGEGFEGYNEFSKVQGPVIDCALMEIDNEAVKKMDSRAYLRVKKDMLIQRCMELYCKEDLMVIDAFSSGFVAKSALMKTKEVICLVENNKECDDVHLELLAFAKADSHIRRWAKIPEEAQPDIEGAQPDIEGAQPDIEDPNSNTKGASTSQTKSPTTSLLDTKGLISKFLAKEPKSR